MNVGEITKSQNIKFLDSNSVGPKMIASQNFKFYNKNVVVSKVADLNTPQVQENQFLVIEKVKKITKKVAKKLIVKKRYEVAKLRQSSINTNLLTKVSDFDFNQFTNLNYTPSPPVDLFHSGQLLQYDDSFDKITTKTKVNISSSISTNTISNSNSNPNATPTDGNSTNSNSKVRVKKIEKSTASSDEVLMAFNSTNTPSCIDDTNDDNGITASDTVQIDPIKGKSTKDDVRDGNEIEVYATDQVLSQLMCTLKSIASWDISITKIGDKLVLDKRDGGVLDFETQDENALESPAVDLAEGLGIEVTNLSLSLRTLLTKSPLSPLVDKDNVTLVKSQTSPDTLNCLNRYRKWDLDGVILYARTTIHASTATPNSTVTSSNTPILNETDKFKDTTQESRVNIYALNQPNPKVGLDWSRKLDSQRGAILTSELKNNAHKLGKCALTSYLSGVSSMKLGFTARETRGGKKGHALIGVIGVRVDEVLGLLGIDLAVGWGIFKAFVLIFSKLSDGDYTLVRDPLKPTLALYSK